MITHKVERASDIHIPTIAQRLDALIRTHPRADNKCGCLANFVEGPELNGGERNERGCIYELEVSKRDDGGRKGRGSWRVCILPSSPRLRCDMSQPVAGRA